MRPLPGASSSERLVLVACVLVATALVYAPSSITLGSLWTEQTYSHGFLVLLISLWLLARDRTRLQAATLRPLPLALAALLLASALWLLFWRAAAQDLHLLMLPLLALITLVAAMGWPTARIAAFPLLFLGFAMPIWGSFRAPLQHLSALAVGRLIWLTGLPAIMLGDSIRLPDGSLTIEEGCSGINFLTVGLAMATLYGELSRDPPRRRLLWLALMGAVALVANWIRIFLIAVIAYTSDMQSPLVNNHYWFGWAIFAAGFAVYLWIAGRLSRRAQPTQRAATASAPPAEPIPTAAPVGRVSLVRLVAALACLAALPLLAYALDSWHALNDPAVAIEWPSPSAGWRSASNDPASAATPGGLFEDWRPQFSGATTQEERRYADAQGASIEIFVVAYRTQRQDAKLVAYSNSLLGPESESEPADEGRLQLLSERIVASPVGRWREMSVADPSGAESLIWSRYQIGAREFVRPRLSQLWYGVAALAGAPVASLSAVRAVCAPTCEAARARLTAALPLLPSVHPAAVSPRTPRP
jgi:exosortase